MERTLVLIKPDGVKRKLIGEVLATYEKKDLDIVALKMVTASRDLAEKHYIEHKGRDYYEELVDFITEGPLCALIIEGENVVNLVRKVNGNKNPLESDLASIRGKFCKETTRNLVHASDSKEAAEREIALWFSELKK